MEDLEIYQTGRILAEDEYLLKIAPPNYFRKFDAGYLTKLTKKGDIPFSFIKWHDSEIYIFNETFRSNWKVIDTRIGKSQQWIILLHPDKFTVEIYLENFLELLEKNTIIKGVLQGEFKWCEHKLIKNK